MNEIEIINGEIRDLVPVFTAHVGVGGMLVFDKTDSLSLTVDTGFSGGIALPLKTIDQMNLEVVDFDTFRLATGKVIELPVFLGKVIIDNQEVETWFIPGDGLIGMEFLAAIGSVLSLDFKNKSVKLMR
jgi:predicted aspartyl protease